MTLLLSAPLLLPACAPEDEDSDKVQTDTLNFEVFDPAGPVVEGVVIAVDHVDGSRVELVTDADGSASVEMDIDDFAGAISHVDGRSLTVVTATWGREDWGDDETIGMFSWSLEPVDSTVTTTPYADWVTISGALLHKAELHSSALVSTTIPGWAYQADDTISYEIGVPPGQAFTMVALEFQPDPDWGEDRIIDHVFHGWATLDQPGLTEDTVIDVDFADAAEPTYVSGSVPMPQNELLATGGAFYMELLGDAAWVGFSSHTEVGDDEAHFDFEAEYLSLAGTTPGAWLSVTTTEGAGSYLSLSDWLPVEGAQDPGLPEPPHRTAPLGAGPFAWDAKVAWEEAEYPVISYWADAGQVGVVYVGNDEEEYTMPAFPSSSTRLSTGTHLGEVATCTSTNEDPACEGWASEGYFVVEAPF